MSTPDDPRLHDALAAHHAGDIAAAEVGYRAVLSEEPHHPGARLLLGLALRDRGAWAEARGVLAGVQTAEAALVLAEVCGADSDPEAAAAALSRAVALDPDHGAAWLNLGVQRAALDDPTAATALRRAAALLPQDPRPSFNLGNEHARRGRPVEACSAWRAALARDPDHLGARLHLGRALVVDHPAEAADLLRAVCAAAPTLAAAWAPLGHALLATGHPGEAAEALGRALSLDPDPATRRARAVALRQAGRWDEARHEAAGLPDTPEARALRLELQRMAADPAGLAALERAVAGDTQAALAEGARPAETPWLSVIRGAAPQTQVAVARAWAMATGQAAGTADQAAGTAGQAAGTADQAAVAGQVADPSRPTDATAGQAAGTADQAAVAGQAAATTGQAAVADQAADPSRPTDATADKPTESAPGAAAREAAPSAASPLVPADRGEGPALPPARLDPGVARPLRVGFLTGDLGDHPVSWLVGGVVSALDRRRVSPVALDTAGRSSPEAAAVRARFDATVELSGLGDGPAAERIQAEDLDVTVDLSGPTTAGRPGILARRPAPVQLEWLGFPGPSGAPWIDAVLADAVVLPTEEAAALGVRVLHLPHTYQPTDSGWAVGPTTTRSAHRLPDDAVVLAAFHQPAKLGPAAVAAYGAVLRRCPQATLWLWDLHPTATENLRQALVASGARPSQLVAAPRLPRPAHLARLALADLALDCWPWGGHTTTTDALFQGVPVVAWRGAAFASRVSTSLLRAAGLGALSVEPEAWEDAVVALVHGANERSVWAARAEAARRSPLFDTAGFARDLAALLEDAAGRA